MGSGEGARARARHRLRSGRRSELGALKRPLETEGQIRCHRMLPLIAIVRVNCARCRGRASRAFPLIQRPECEREVVTITSYGVSARPAATPEYRQSLWYYLRRSLTNMKPPTVFLGEMTNL